MKAVVKTKPGTGNVEIADVPKPKATGDTVLIEVKAVGICGTDIHIYYDEYRSKPPVVLGHELAGVVAEVGDQVKTLSVGDRVTTETYFKTCESCYYCRNGMVNLCPDRMSIGSIVNGGMAKYCLVPEKNIHRLPDNVDFTEGAMTEPLACVVHSTLNMAKITPGDVAVVSGPGAIGLLTAQVVKQSGAVTLVLGTDHDVARLETAKELGVDYVVNVSKEDPKELVDGLTDGKGADVVLECAGVEASVGQCMKLVRRKGQYTQIGLAGKSVRFDIDQVVFKEVLMRGGFASIPSTWDRAIKLMELGKVKVKPLISHVLPITDWEHAFDLFHKKSGLKILLTPID